jgi:hypothetical protein
MLATLIWSMTMLVSVTPTALKEIGERRQLAQQGVSITGSVIAQRVPHGTRNCESSGMVRYTVESQPYDLALYGDCKVPAQLVGENLQVKYLSANPAVAQAYISGMASRHRFTWLRLLILWATVVYLCALMRHLWKTRLNEADPWFAPSSERYQWRQPIYWRGLGFYLLHMCVLFVGLVNLGRQGSLSHFVCFATFFCSLLVIRYAKSEPD